MGKAIRVGLLASVLAISACGGGGGGAPPPEALLSGSYAYVYLDRDVGGDGVYSEIATLTADGAGWITFGDAWQTGENEPGVSLRRSNAPYQVGSGGNLRVNGSFPAPLTGRVSSNGSYAAATTPEDEMDPGWFCAVRRDASPALADLVGTWRLVEWTRYGTDPDVGQSLMAAFTVDGVGNIAVADLHYNRNGVIDPVMLLSPASRFAVATGGVVRVTALGTTTWEGALSASGDVLLLGRPVGANGQAGVRVLVREGGAAGDEAVSGTWALSGWEAFMPGYACLQGTVQFDGAGAGTWFGDPNADSGLVVGTTRPIQYGVGVNGLTTLIWPGWNVATGCAVPRLVVLGGGLVDGRPPCLHVLIR